ncbi:MAG: hypothetical protein AB1488_07460, partial [Nitrospirota bacterium]
MKRFLTIILLITLLSGVYSCGGGGGGSSGGGSGSGGGTSAVTITLGAGSFAARVDIERKTLLASIKRSPIIKKIKGIFIPDTAFASIPSSVVSVRFTISASDMSTITRTVDTAGKSEIVEEFDVDNGTNRRF